MRCLLLQFLYMLFYFNVASSSNVERPETWHSTFTFKNLFLFIFISLSVCVKKNKTQKSIRRDHSKIDHILTLMPFTQKQLAKHTKCSSLHRLPESFRLCNQGNNFRLYYRKLISMAKY